MRRAFAFSLAALMLASTACGGSEASSETTVATNTTTSAPETEADIYEGLRDLDFGGYEFSVMTYDDTSVWATYSAPEEETGDVLNDMAYRRNREVEDMLNIAINKVIGGEFNSAESTFRNLVLAGEPEEADLFMFWSPGDRSSFLTEGVTYDWKDVPHVKLESKWYNQTANEAFTIAGTQYFAVSDYTFPIQQHFRMLFNKTLAEDFGVTDIYDSVLDGTWTFDKMLASCKNAYADLDGDGAKSLGDRYGLAVNAAFASAFPLNFGEIQVRNSKDGFELNLFSEKIVSSVEKIVAMNENPDIFVNPVSGNDQYEIFKSGNAIFMTYGSDPAMLRDYEFDFGYIPYPKYDESQEDYVVWSAGGMMAIPASAGNIDRTGAIIEALSAGSNKYVKDAFVEKYIEGKVLRDSESQEIYRMMRDLATYDLSYNIDPSGMLASYAYYSYFMSNGSADVASRYAAIKDSVETAYADLWNQIVAG